MNYIIENKEWLFSGAALTVIPLVIWLLNKHINPVISYFKIIISYKINSKLYNQTDFNEKLYIKPELYIYDKKVIITGEPGSGKTLFLKNMIKEYIDKKQIKKIFAPITVYLNASMITNSVEDTILVDVMKLKLNENNKLKIKNKLRNGIISGKIILLIDGLDNLAGSHAREKHVINQINNYMMSKKLIIYLTCRSEYYNNKYKKHIRESKRGVGLTEYVIPHFSIDEIFEFIEKEENEQLLQCNFKKSIDESWEIKRLVKNPMLLSILVFINIDRLNNNLNCITVGSRHELYKKYYAILLKKGKNNINNYSSLKEYSFLLNNDQIIPMLSYISYYLLNINSYNSSTYDFFNVIRRFYHDSGLEDVSKNTKLINEINNYLISANIIKNNERFISFFHDSTMEFYCSSYFSYKKYRELMTLFSIDPEKWSEVFRFWFSSHVNILTDEEKEEIITFIIKFDIVTALHIFSDSSDNVVLDHDLLKRIVAESKNMYETDPNERILRAYGVLSTSSSYFLSKEVYSIVLAKSDVILNNLKRLNVKNAIKGKIVDEAIKYLYPLSLVNHKESSQKLFNFIAFSQKNNLKRLESSSKKYFLELRDASSSFLEDSIYRSSYYKEETKEWERLKPYFLLLVKQDSKKSVEICIRLILDNNLNVKFSPYFCSRLFETTFKRNLENNNDTYNNINLCSDFTWVFVPFQADTKEQFLDKSLLIASQSVLALTKFFSGDSATNNLSEIKINSQILIPLCAITYFDESTIGELNDLSRKKLLFLISSKTYFGENRQEFINEVLNSISPSIRWFNIFSKIPLLLKERLLLRILQENYKPNKSYWDESVLREDTFSIKNSIQYRIYVYLVATVSLVSCIFAILHIWKDDPSNIDIFFSSIFMLFIYLSWKVYLKDPLKESNSREVSYGFLLLYTIFSPILSVISRLVLPKLIMDSYSKKGDSIYIESILMNLIPAISWLISISAIWIFVLLKHAEVHNIIILVSGSIFLLVIVVKKLWNSAKEKMLKLSNGLAGILFE